MPWMRFLAARGRTPPGLEPYNQTTVQETLANHPDCNGTLQCALNSCRVLFATAGMVATRRKLLLQGDPQTRFAFSFVDESSRHSIPVGLDLAAFGAQCMFCGDAGQLRPYSAITLLATAAKAEGGKNGKGGKVPAQHIAWPQSEHFANLKADCRRWRLVQGTQEHGPLVIMVNRIARKLIPKWFTWTTIQLSCNETTAPHQHRFDSTPWSAVFSTGRHLGGEIWVEEGGVGSGPRGRPGRRQCPDGISRPGHRYRVDRQPVVVRTGAWHATCPWKGDRRLVVLYGRGELQSLPASHRKFLQQHAFRLPAG